MHEWLIAFSVENKGYNGVWYYYMYENLVLMIKFLLDKVGSIPRLEQRLKCMHLRIKFAEEVNDVKPVSITCF